MEAVTLRHLMTHSAGFRASTWPWGGDQPWQPFEPLHWEQLVAMFPYTEIRFPPGSRFSYSNPGIIFLGRVIEELTTDDYEVYVDKNILKPLEMYRSYFDTTPYHLKEHRAHSYFLKGEKPVAARFDHNTGITVSNSGLNAPLGDMVKYLSFLMGDPAKQELYDGILVRSSLEEMWKPQIEVPEEGEGGGQSIGLIFFLEEHNGMRFVAHSGDQNAFISHFYLNPASRSAYLVAYNTMPAEGEGGAGDAKAADREIRDYLMQNVFPLFSAGNGRPPLGGQAKGR
jgi:CubicO group peptidase (beta-lactamase class C family)